MAEVRRRRFQGPLAVPLPYSSEFGAYGWVPRCLCTAYGKGSLYEGTEGELYDRSEDPGQRHNLWDDPARKHLKSGHLAQFNDSRSVPEPHFPALLWIGISKGHSRHLGM